MKSHNLEFSALRLSAKQICILIWGGETEFFAPWTVGIERFGWVGYVGGCSRSEFKKERTTLIFKRQWRTLTSPEEAQTELCCTVVARSSDRYMYLFCLKWVNCVYYSDMLILPRLSWTWQTSWCFSRKKKSHCGGKQWTDASPSSFGYENYVSKESIINVLISFMWVQGRSISCKKTGFTEKETWYP